MVNYNKPPCGLSGFISQSPKVFYPTLSLLNLSHVCI